MIPIEYDNSKLDEYNAFIDKFLENLDHYLTNGYIGNRKSIKVLEARKFYNSLSASQKIYLTNRPNLDIGSVWEIMKLCLFPYHLWKTIQLPFSQKSRMNLKTGSTIGRMK